MIKYLLRSKYMNSVVVHGKEQFVKLARTVAVMKGRSKFIRVAVLNPCVNMSLVYDTFWQMGMELSLK